MICGSVWQQINMIGTSIFLAGAGKKYLWGGPEDSDLTQLLHDLALLLSFLSGHRISRHIRVAIAHPLLHCIFPISLLTHGYLSSRPLFPLRTTRVKNNTQSLESKRLPQAVFCLFKSKTKRDKSALSGITGLTSNSSSPGLAESFKFPWFYRSKFFFVVVVLRQVLNVAQASLKLTILCLRLLRSRITGMCYYAWIISLFKKNKYILLFT